MPLVSIIIATFNAAEVLKTALESVKKQSFQDWECIIVDGASKDNTVEIVSSYENEDSRFKHISEPDKGIYDAFNKGWKLAKGEWVYYLGADDQILQNSLSQVFSVPRNEDIVYGDIIFHNERGFKHSKSLSLNKLKGNMISHQSILMRKKLIEDLSGFDMMYKVCADFDLFQRALIRTKSITHVPVEIAIFEAGGASSAGKVFLKERFALHKKYGSFTLALKDILVERTKIVARRFLK